MSDNRRKFDKEDVRYQPSTREILAATGLFLKETGKEYSKPTVVEHKCPERRKLAEKSPSKIVVAANNAGKDIPLNQESAKGFRRQAKLEKKPMGTADIVEHTAAEIQIRDGFNERADKLRQEAAQLEKQGLLTPEDAEKYRTQIAYNRAGAGIHSFLYSAKGVAIPGSTVEKMYKLEQASKKYEKNEAEAPSSSYGSNGERSPSGGCLVM